MFPSDHVYDAPCEEGATEGLHITVIVHGMAGTNEFREMHAAALDALSNVCGATYAVRFHYRSVMDFPLYGWGATLDIKNMEYVAVDDREQCKKGTDEAQIHAMAMLVLIPKLQLAPLPTRSLRDILSQADGEIS